MSKHYYQILLEIFLKREDKVLGFVNISHIPYKKFEEIFADDITEDQRFLFDDVGSYIITEELYLKHEEYLRKQIDFNFRFDLFLYSVGLVSIEADKYQKNYYERLPPMFQR
ncbi:hypothetical protein SIO70_25390 [Chitinophaga sancti]|uniref:hypothetical protein n=1 Tax=Chitinophaga sancti TaxID=1004 RepID=UPI002A74F66C|nr:hypothetical protein [Chitinophaga sancti]WPQ61699.1 hypothetical protein SIO70_25390 [Chitinophaga sancti]